MLVDEKPPLDEDLLMHFGIKGMHWGVRKARDSGGSGRSSAPKRKPMSVKNKTILVGMGAGIALGAATTAFILAKRGGVKLPKASTIARAESTIKLRPRFRTIPAPPPSPFAMRLEAGRAAHVTLLSRQMNQSIVDKTWRDAAKMSRMIRENADKSTALENSLLSRNDAILKSLQNTNWG